MRIPSSRGLVGFVLALWVAVPAQTSAQSPASSSSSSKHTKASSARLAPDLEAGAVANGVYRNRVLGLSCKIPGGWVLRTEEMNAKEEAPESSGVVNSENPHFSQNQGEVGHPAGSRPVSTACYISDLIPTTAHIDLTWGMGFDLYPLETIESKKRYYARAIPEKWLTVFTHDAKVPWAYVEEDDSGKMVTKGV